MHKKNDQDILKLKFWLGLDPENKTRAMKLARNWTTTSVDMWTIRGIPRKLYKDIMEMIDGDIAKSGQKGKGKETSFANGVRT